MNLIFLLMPIVFFVSSAHGRIGETISELDARYGKVERAYNSRRIYIKNGIKITCSMIFQTNAEKLTERVGQITYRKVNNQNLTSSEVATLLKANLEGHSYANTTPQNREWKTFDGLWIYGAVVAKPMFYTSDYAFYADMEEQIRLIIYMEEYASMLLKMEKDKAKQQFEGF